jgi:hypothetical protein
VNGWYPVKKAIESVEHRLIGCSGLEIKGE